MPNRREYDIAFVGLKPGVTVFEYVLGDEFFEAEKPTDFSHCNARVRLLLDKHPGFMQMKFEVGGQTAMQCNRCGNPLDIPLMEDFEMVVKMVDMKSGLLWREVITALHKREYADVQLEHMLADALGMQLVRWPKQFDVIVTDNLFGDMLSDVASMLTGSLGMLPSASLGAADSKGQRKAMYEPVHGSAPDIAGKGIANPIAMIGSLGMAMRYSFNLPKAADAIEAAISAVLAQGMRTADIKGEAAQSVSTSEMGNAIVAQLKKLLA